MNYYERHLGDYARDTAHLSLLEHGAYTLLLDRCYATERGIPADQAHRVARARTREEKAAVDAVLAEFFTLADGVWTNRRVVTEIARFTEGEPEREIKKANEANRLKRFRDERARLFKTLTDAGEHAAWNIGMTELRALVQRLQSDSKPLPDTSPATAPATPATATNPQTPDTITQTPDVLGGEARPTPAEACKAMKLGGMQAVNPSSPTLIALLEAGITLQELTDAAQDAVRGGKNFAWALAAAGGRRRDAAAAVKDLPGIVNKQESLERRNRKVADAWASEGKPHAAH